MEKVISVINVKVWIKEKLRSDVGMYRCFIGEGNTLMLTRDKNIEFDIPYSVDWLTKLGDVFNFSQADRFEIKYK